MGVHFKETGAGAGGTRGESRSQNFEGVAHKAGGSNRFRFTI